jgi:hypothetical protein
LRAPDEQIETVRSATSEFQRCVKGNRHSAGFPIRLKRPTTTQSVWILDCPVLIFKPTLAALRHIKNNLLSFG